MTDDDRTVELDRSGSVWTGRFPGLGEVRVDADGGLSVRTETDDPDAEAALRHGWGELLALARRGVPILNGTSVAPAADAPAALLTGPSEFVGVLTAALAGLGWTVVGDRLSPVDISESKIRVLPRPTPVLTPRSMVQGGLSEANRPARRDTDVLVTGATTSAVAHELAGLVEVTRRRVGEDDDETLIGHERFALASGLHVLGALRPFRPDDDHHDDHDGDGDEHAGSTTGAPQLLIADHLRLAELPALRVRVGTDPDDAARRVASWFTTTTAG